MQLFKVHVYQYQQFELNSEWILWIYCYHLIYIILYCLSTIYSYGFNLMSKCSFTLSKYSLVFKYIPSFTFFKPCIQAARSLVIWPASTLPTQASSNVSQNLYDIMIRLVLVNILRHLMFIKFTWQVQGCYQALPCA